MQKKQIKLRHENVLFVSIM